MRRYTEHIRISHKLAKLSEESSKVIKTLLPKDKKQNFSLRLLIFNETTDTAISSYFQHRPVMSGFIDLFQKWWTLANPKK